MDIPVHRRQAEGCDGGVVVICNVAIVARIEARSKGQCADNQGAEC